MCSYRQDTCIIVCVYCGASCSSLLKRSEAGSWPKLKGMTVTFGQNQEQSVFCLYCFIHSSSLSVLAAVLSLSYSISFFTQNCTTEKKKWGHGCFFSSFLSPFSPLCFGATFDWKTAVVHIVQFVVYTDLNSALFQA